MSLTPDQPIAFISVFDKTKLEPLARALVESYNYQIISTGGTKRYLEGKGIKVTESSEITGFGNLLDGRVKSLHPDIFAGILAKRTDESHEVKFKIDTVVVNLYPFEREQTSAAAAKDEKHLLEFIDIGGVSLIRAAAKNYPDVNVLCEPDSYDAFLQEMKLGDGQTSQPFKKKLALQAFKRSAEYDTAIHQYFVRCVEGKEAVAKTVTIEAGSLPSELSDTIGLSLNKVRDLRYGENPHQQAALYTTKTDNTEEDFEQLNGKALSFNNIVDMEAAWNIISEFRQEPTCAVIKHCNPCGVALGRNALDAYERAFGADPLSAFGGIVAFNCTVTLEAAKLMKPVFLELIIAPDFEAEALELLQSKKNLRLIKRNLHNESPSAQLDIKQASANTFLVQVDSAPTEHRIEYLADTEAMSVVTQHKPDDAQTQDLMFAWKVAKHVKSNAIVLVKDGKTVGMGVGQTSRIGALEIALRQACDEAKGAVMASDGFLPAIDNIQALVQARVAAVIQPGGSIKDKDVIALANQHEIPMVTTGIREFKH